MLYVPAQRSRVLYCPSTLQKRSWPGFAKSNDQLSPLRSPDPLPYTHTSVGLICLRSLYLCETTASMQVPAILPENLHVR
jgi:hypothetical protein